MNRTQDGIGLSVEQWRALARGGHQVSVTIPVMGTSMRPVIRYAVDPVTVVPLRREPLVGDIVLFQRQDGALVIHRVYRLLDGGRRVQTWGDNCYGKDRPVSREDILGLVVSVKRNGREISLDTPRQRRWGVRWMRIPGLRPVWFALNRLRWLPGKLIRWIWPGFRRERS